MLQLHKLPIAGLMILAIIPFSIWVFRQSQTTVQSSQIYSSFNYDPELFYKGVNKAKQMPNESPTPVRGGITPHDILASFMIADFFEQLQSSQPKTIILLGPNHYEAGDAPVQTSSYGWNSPFGIVDSNRAMITALIKSGLVQDNPRTFTHEHSVGALIPFIKHYLPKTTIVPLVFKKQADLKQLTQLAELLAKKDLFPDTVVVASVDFSHYLQSEVADKKDEATLKAMRTLDVEQIDRFNSDYMDSPPAIITLLLTMNQHNPTEFKILEHTNSAKLIHDFTVKTTSYFTMIFAER